MTGTPECVPEVAQSAAGSPLYSSSQTGLTADYSSHWAGQSPLLLTVRLSVRQFDCLTVNQTVTLSDSQSDSFTVWQSVRQCDSRAAKQWDSGTLGQWGSETARHGGSGTMGQQKNQESATGGKLDIGW